MRFLSFTAGYPYCLKNGTDITEIFNEYRCCIYTSVLFPILILSSKIHFALNDLAGSTSFINLKPKISAYPVRVVNHSLSPSLSLSLSTV